MPTLAARNSPAILITAATTTLPPATTMTTISTNLDAATATSSSAIQTTTPAGGAAVTTNNSNATCTFSPTTGAAMAATATNQHHQHQHYHHPPLPPPPVSLPPPHPVGMTPALTVAATTVGATGLTTFNGNSNLNVANGNIGSGNVVGGGGGGVAPHTIGNNSNGSNNGNNNNNNSSSNNIIMSSTAVANKSETFSPSTAASGISTSSSASSMKNKIAISLHASREDVTSLGGASSVNSQMSATVTTTTTNNNTNNSNSNGGGSTGTGITNNNNNIIKGSKENLLQNYYNGNGGNDGNDGGGIGSSIRNIENDDPGDGLGPLPSKWETAYTERGELYFIDHNTGTSHWLDPRLSKFQKKSLEDCGDDELPYGWEKIEDSLYGTYYIDHVNRRTQYENPVLEAKRRAAEQTQKQQQQQRPQTPSSMLNGGAGGMVGGRISAALHSTVAAISPCTTGVAAINSIAPNTMLDISQRGMQPPPPLPPLMGGGSLSMMKSLLPYKFTRNPAEMQGERITTTLVKSARGLGITIVGGDDGAEEFLQIKTIVPHGPAWQDGQLQTGDILVYVNDTCVLGFTHHEMVNVFQSIMPGDTVMLEVCRGYSLPFDPNDPNTEVVTTIAVDGIHPHSDLVPRPPPPLLSQQQQRRALMQLHMDGNYNFLDLSGGDNKAMQQQQLQQHKFHVHAQQMDAVGAANNTTTATNNGGFVLMKKFEVHTFSIVKGAMGFGFTIADSSYGQKVKKILDRNCCTNLQEGDILLEINDMNVRNKSHLEVVQVLKDCSKVEPTIVKIQRGVSTNASSLSPSITNYNTNGGVGIGGGGEGAGGGGSSAAGNVAKLRKNFIGNTAALFRSKTPTADLYSTQQKEILPIRPKTPLVDTRRARVKTPNNELNHNDDEIAAALTTNGDRNNSNCIVERTLAESKSQVDGKSTNSLQEIDAIINQDIPPFMDPYPKLVTSLSERLAEATLLGETISGRGGMVGGTAAPHGYHHLGGGGGITLARGGVGVPNYENQEYVTASSHSNHSGNYNPIYGLSPLPPTMSPLNPMQLPSHHTHAAYSLSTPLSLMTTTGGVHHHHESCYCYDCQDYRSGLNKYRHHPSPQQQQQPAQQHHQQHQQQPLSYYNHQSSPASSSTLTPLLSHHHAQYSPAAGTATATPLQAAHIQNERMQRRVNELLSDRRKVGFSPLDGGVGAQHHSHTLGGVGTMSSYLPTHHQQQLQQQQHSPAISSISQQPTIAATWNAGGGYNTLQPLTTQASIGGGGGVGVGSGSFPSPQLRNGLDVAATADIDNGIIEQYDLTEVTLERQALGFGFRIVGGTEEGSQVTVGHIVPGGAADNDHRVNTGDEILSIDGINVVNSSHHKVVSLMGEAALRGQVSMILRRRMRIPTLSQQQQHQLQTLQQQQQQQQRIRYPYDVIVSRNENEGFGFVIISSSNQYYGSTIGKLIPGSPADRCGELKVGDRIIAVNRIDIAGMSHGDVVNLIKESGLHVRLTIGCPAKELITSSQASPEEISQTQLQLHTTPIQQQLGGGSSPQPMATKPHQQQLQQHQQMQNSDAAANMYFERPSTSAAAAVAAITQQQQQQQHQMQQPQL